MALDVINRTEVMIVTPFSSLNLPSTVSASMTRVVIAVRTITTSNSYYSFTKRFVSILFFRDSSLFLEN